MCSDKILRMVWGLVDVVKGADMVGHGQKVTVSLGQGLARSAQGQTNEDADSWACKGGHTDRETCL